MHTTLLALPSLEQVLDRFPVTVTSETATIAAIALMQHERTHYALVMHNTTILGILTERDVIRSLAEGVDLSTTAIVDVMTQNVITLPLSVGVSTVLTTLIQHHIRQVPILNDANQLIGIVTDKRLQKVLQPIDFWAQAEAEYTARQRAEAALYQLHERFTIALEAAQIDIWEWDLRTHEIVWKPSTKSSFAAIDTVQAWRDRVHPDDLAKIESCLQTSRDCHQDYECEYRIRDTDGNFRTVAALGRFHYSDAGDAIRMIGMVRDLSNQKQLEAQFLRAQRLESLGALASGIAHDLNNVLTPILAVSQYLQLRFPMLDDRNQQMLKMLETNARRGADLVKQVLSFARGVEGRRGLLQVGHLLIEIAQIIKRTFPKSIEVRTHIPTPSLWTVFADMTQLHQVIMNLCVNARDAMPDGGTVTIAAENRTLDESFVALHPEARIGNYVMISVSDTGTGIPPHVLSHIFEPFFTTKAIGEGTGLGLSTAIEILKTHNGFIHVTSAIEQGTRFQVYLPAVDGFTTLKTDADTTLENADKTESLMGQGELILIVDDEAAVQDIAKTVLEEHQYRVITAANGVEAIAQYTRHQQEIRLVIMDIMMPSMGGLTAIKTLQKIDPKLKIIATSGLITTAYLNELANAGIKSVLPKPYAAPDLLKCIQQVLMDAWV